MRRKTLQIIMIAVLLGVRPVPAEAMTIKQCDALSDLVEHAMDLRRSGMPIQRALDRYELEAGPLGAWQGIVVLAYTLEQQFLTGTSRADLLSQLYAQCLTNGEAL